MLRYQDFVDSEFSGFPTWYFKNIYAVQEHSGQKKLSVKNKKMSQNAEQKIINVQVGIVNIYNIHNKCNKIFSRNIFTAVCNI